MKTKSLLIVSAIVALIAAIIWQQSVINKLKAGNEQLREKSGRVDELQAENERLSREQVDVAELERLRASQSELLRLRAQVSQLKRDVQDAKAAAAMVAKASQQSSPASVTPSELPVQIFKANVTASIGWNQSIVTGGWKTPSGKRALVFVQPIQDSDSGANSVVVQTRVVELPENVLSSMGFDSLRTDNPLSANASELSPEAAQNLFSAFKQTDDVDLLSAPTVVTLSGRQAQIQVIDFHTAPSGETYTTGPTIDVVPTIAADGKTVEMVVSAQVNYPQAQPGH